MRRGGKPAKAKADAKPVRARTSLKSDDSRVRNLEKLLAGALEQQTATAELLQTRNRELTQALERETASADLLRIISASPTDLGPVFETILDRALALCDATVGAVARCDGDLVGVAAVKGPPDLVQAVHASYPRRLTDSGHMVRAIRERRTLQVADVVADPASFRIPGTRSQVTVPMLKDGEALGAIAITRSVPGLFSDEHVRLLETFADQAVIAIENVRLFTELQGKNRALTEAHAQVTEALDQQTATSEILRVISSSPTEIQPVFDTIVRSAVRLCSGMIAGVSLVRDGMLHHPANYGGSPEALAAIRGRYPRPLDMSSLAGIVILTRSVCEAPDVEDPSVPEFTRDAGRILRSRSFISVPMLREGERARSSGWSRSMAHPLRTCRSAQPSL